MAKNIFIAATEPNSGKSAISIGLLDAFERLVPDVGYIKPIAQRFKNHDTHDADATLLKEVFHMEAELPDMNPVSMKDIQADKDQAIEEIMHAYNTIAKDKDVVVIEGTDYTSSTSALEFDINAEVAKNLGAPVLLVANGRGRSVEDILSNITECRDSFEDNGCHFLGVIVNKLDTENYDETYQELQTHLAQEETSLFGAVPFSPILAKPRLIDVVEALNATVIYRGDDLLKIVVEPKIFAMSLENGLSYINDKDGYLVITPGDRADVITAIMAAQMSGTYPKLSGIILTGGMEPGACVKKLIGGLGDAHLSILSVPGDTYVTALQVNEVTGDLKQNDYEKIDLAGQVVEQYVDTKRLYDQIGLEKADIRTPKMFIYELLERARSDKKHIVLPEGMEPRILQATEKILSRDICDITLLGDQDKILEKAKTLDVDIREANIIDPAGYPGVDEFAATLYELRKHKGVTEERARDLVLDPIYFGTMMVHRGDADGFVSGSTHTTADTIRPVLQIIKTKPDVSLASSIFFMCLSDRVLVYGDCALVQDPNAEELADIAVTSAETAQSFGVDPFIAMLSYSTGSSGQGKVVDKVREATEIARRKRPDLMLEGPIQYDAAISREVANVKLKDSKVGGKATVYIFPDLNSGNIAYKAVQRSANILAIGPVLQGVNKPANDLSRGATVEDILYTVAITAVQAQYSQSQKR